MKKLLSLVLALAMLVSLCTVFAVGGTVSAASAVGDINGDGVINSKDSLLLRKYIAGVVASINTTAADVTGDGRVTSRDTIVLQQYLAGAITSFSGTSSGYPVKSVSICGNDLSTYEIVVKDPSSESLAYENYHFASRQLRNYINDCNGYELSITYSPSANKHHIYLVFSEPGSAMAQELGKEGYIWRTEDNGDVYLIGGYRRGCAYAVFDFLKEYFGWRWFGCDMTTCIGAPKVSVPKGLDYKYVPQLEYRDVHTEEWIDNDRYDSMGMLCNAEHVNSHTDRYYMGGEKYGVQGEGNVWANAHSFYMMAGDGNSQPCLTDWRTANAIVNFWVNEVSHRHNNAEDNSLLGFNLTRVSSSWNDNENYCFCENCDAVYREEQSIAGTIVRMNNEVSADIHAVLPQVETYYIAYGSARIPPVKTKPGPYTCICYCWNGCNNHLFNSDDCDEGNVLGYRNWEEQYYFEAWARISPKIFGWYYSTSFSWNIGPCPNLMNIREDFRYWAECGIDGIYAEGEGDAVYSFEALRNYLMAECMWNPYMSEEEYEQCMDEFLEYYYGPGWKYIRQYIDIATEAGDRCGCFTNNFDWPGNMYDFSYMYSQFDTIVNLFNNAKSAASSSFESENIEKLSVHAYFAAICGAFNNGAGYNSTVQSRYSEMNNYVRKYGYVASVYGYPGDKLTTSQSPITAWLDLVADGKWETWYRQEGRTFPRDDTNPNIAGRKSVPYMASQPTKTYNPYENLGK